MTNRPDYALEIRRALNDPRKLCVALGIDLKRARSQGGNGLLVCCPIHQERSPSCSITVGRDHTIRVRCFGCEWTGDALSLVADVEQIPRSDFREILARAAEHAGLHGVVDEIQSGKPAPNRPEPKPLPPPDPPKPYLEGRIVQDFWRACTPVNEDREACRYLVGRQIDPDAVATRQLARVIPPRSTLPRWASYRGGAARASSWETTGHRIVVRAFGSLGGWLGVRAMRVRDGDSPKRLPPSGYRASELVLGNAAAYALFTGARRDPPRVVIVEGEPDWLLWSTLTEEPVIGLMSGSWTERFAERIPDGCRVVIRTHEDPAGEKYAQQVIGTLKKRRVTILRSNTEAAA